MAWAYRGHMNPETAVFRWCGVDRETRASREKTTPNYIYGQALSESRILFTSSYGTGESEALESTRAALLAEITEQMSAMRASARQAGFRHLLGRSISLTHLHVLALVRSQGAMPISELARRLDISVASATGVVSRMEER